MLVGLSFGRKCTDWIVTAINPMIDHDSFARLSFERLLGRRCPTQEREEAETAIGSVVGYALGRGAFLFSKPERPEKVAEVILAPAELPYGTQDGNHALGVLGLGFKFGDKLDVILSQLKATAYQADVLDDRIICELTTGNDVGYRLVMVVLKSGGLSHLDMISFEA